MMKSVLLALTLLSSPAFASDENSTTLSGVRVNPGKISLRSIGVVKIHDGFPTKWLPDQLKLHKLDLNDPTGLAAFHKHIVQLQASNEGTAKATGKKKGYLPKAAAAALDEMVRLATLLLSPLSQNDKADALVHLAEVTEAFNYNFQHPVPRTFAEAAPFVFLDELSNPITEDTLHPAKNIVVQKGQDSSAVDPVDSSFWKNPGRIESKNLYYGFGRSEIPNFDKPCTYDEPKDGFGTSGGFSIKCDKKKYKIKFGFEAKSEPFTARIVWAMGFNTVPIDHIRNVRVIYDRKLLKEYNSRQRLPMSLKSFFGPEVFKKDLQVYRDPFVDGIKEAIIDVNTVIPAAHLRHYLLVHQQPGAEKEDANYNVAFESRIRYLVMNDANVETGLGDNEKNLGPWSWNKLDHPARRELRGLGLLAALLNMYDTRIDNNRLRLRTDEAGRKHLLHYFSDLGSALGDAGGLLKFQGSNANLFPWDFMAQDEVTGTFDIRGFSTIQSNRAFSSLQREDARWMALRLGRLSEQQWIDALVAAGWSAAEAKIYLEKIVNRRDQMIQVLGLEKEVSVFRAAATNRNFNYDPKQDFAMVAYGSRTPVAAPVNQQKIINGQLVPLLRVKE